MHWHPCVSESYNLIMYKTAFKSEFCSATKIFVWFVQEDYEALIPLFGQSNDRWLCVTNSQHIWEAFEWSFADWWMHGRMHYKRPFGMCLTCSVVFSCVLVFAYVPIAPTLSFYGSLAIRKFSHTFSNSIEHAVVSSALLSWINDRKLARSLAHVCV